MPTIAKCACERVWTGVNQAHCSMCHEHFSTVKNFDAHRPGPRRRDGSPTCGKPGALTRTKRTGEKVPVLKAVNTVHGDLWVSWSEDGRYAEEATA